MSVAILMGSDSDLPRLEPCFDTLRALEIPFEARVLSAHRTPAQVIEFVSRAPARGVKTFICAAGGAAHLAGVVAAHTDLPVLGIPLDNPPLGGLDALLSTVQMPGGIPVAAPRVGSIHETVIHEKTGLLTTPLDPFSTADALSRLLDNAVWSRQLGENGRSEVEQFWSLDTMVGGYENLISTLYKSKATSLGLPEWLGAKKKKSKEFDLAKNVTQQSPSTVPGSVFQSFQPSPTQVS